MAKTVLITGASSGFGKLAAKTFQRNGWNVIATMRSPEKEKELNKLKNVLVRPLDVTDRETIQHAVDAGMARFGRIDALVNNAGYGAVGYFEQASEEEARKQMETNFMGVVNMTQAVVPVMRQQKSGVIINITSIAGAVGFPMLSLYNASKFAVEGLSESLKYELGQFGISVKTVAPGAFKTNFGDACNFTEGNDKEDLREASARFRQRYAEMIENPPKPFGYGDPQDVADCIYKCAVSDMPDRNYVGKDAKMVLFFRKVMPRKMFSNMLKNSLLPKD